MLGNLRVCDCIFFGAPWVNGAVRLFVTAADVCSHKGESLSLHTNAEERSSNIAFDVALWRIVQRPVCSGWEEQVAMVGASPKKN